MRGLLFALAAGSLLAQTPAFEVASIKPAPPVASMQAQMMSGKFRVGINIDANRVDIANMPLSAVIQAAYKIKPYQLTGPSWLGEQRWDIVAKMPDGATSEQVPEMLQALLADRFKLAVHRDSKEQPVYALVVGKGGSKLKESPAPEAVNPDVPKDGFAVETPGGKMMVTPDLNGAVVNSQRFGKMRVTMGQDRLMHMETERMTMAALADQLSSMLDRPVFDRTELNGQYQVTLELAITDLMQAARAQGVNIPLMPAIPATASDPAGGSVFESVQKLGLRLDPRKMPVELIVIDHLEKTPTEN